VNDCLLSSILSTYIDGLSKYYSTDFHSSSTVLSSILPCCPCSINQYYSVGKYYLASSYSLSEIHSLLVVPIHHSVAVINFIVASIMPNIVWDHFGYGWTYRTD